MKSLMGVLVAVLAVAGAGAAADFPSDTLLPVNWVQTFVEPGFDSDSASFTYARDARDWLHETRVITEKSGYLSTTVSITDREGRYRGGSFQKRTDPLITITAQHDSAGRLSRNVLEVAHGVYHEDFAYDARGGLISKTMTDSNGVVTKQSLWANTYDAAGRLVLSVESEPLIDFSPWERKYFFDATGRLLYEHRLSGSIDSAEVWDSIAYVYRPDGRLLERRTYDFNHLLEQMVKWEYRVWQVPLSLVRHSRPVPGSPMGYPTGRAFDPLGRSIARRPPGSVPHFARP